MSTDTMQNGNPAETEANETQQEAQDKKGSTGLQVYQSSSPMLRRPISPRQFEIFKTFRTVGGDRPIFASQLKYEHTISESGLRPIASSTLAISQTHSIMGNRPVASNQIDDSTTLMGYID